MVRMHLLSSLGTVAHPRFLVLSKGHHLPSAPLHCSFCPADSTVNRQPEGGGRNGCLSAIYADDPKSCYPSCVAAPSSLFARRRAVNRGGIYAGRKWRPFRRRKTHNEARKFLHLLVYLHRSWPLMLLREGLQSGGSLGLLGSENEPLRRLLLGVIAAAGGERRRKRRVFGGFRALVLLFALVASVFLVLHSQGNAANISTVLPPIVMRRLKEVASMLSIVFRRRGAR